MRFGVTWLGILMAICIIPSIEQDSPEAAAGPAGDSLKEKNSLLSNALKEAESKKYESKKDDTKPDPTITSTTKSGTKPDTNSTKPDTNSTKPADGLKCCEGAVGGDEGIKEKTCKSGVEECCKCESEILGAKLIQFNCKGDILDDKDCKCSKGDLSQTPDGAAEGTCGGGAPEGTTTPDGGASTTTPDGGASTTNPAVVIPIMVATMIGMYLRE